MIIHGHGWAHPGKVDFAQNQQTSRAVTKV
jgi:hypothetical protein